MRNNQALLLAGCFNMCCALHYSTTESALREAVVVPTRTVNISCQFQRLLAILSSSSTPVHKRDVWFLYDEERGPGDPEFIDELKSKGALIEPQPGVPHTGAWESFGGTRSGLTKPSFLIFAILHSGYEYFWFLEDDAFFTGRYSEVFDGAVASQADVIGNLFNQDRGWKYWETCEVLGESCLAGADSAVKLRWPVSRFSRRYVGRLADALAPSKLRTHGHHEALAASFCTRSPWCTLEQLPRIGAYVAAGWGDFSSVEHMTLDYLSGHIPPYTLQVSHIYHPVKCEASASSGLEALRFANVSYTGPRA